MWPVEFGREESRSRLQNLVRPPQLGVFTLEKFDLRLRIRGHTRARTGIHLEAANLGSDRLRGADTEHPGDRNRRRMLTRVIRPHLSDHTDSALTKLARIPAGT